MPSFDIKSELNLQEVKNAINQATKEINTRFDFKDTNSTIELRSNTELVLESSTPERLKAVLDVLKEKLVKRKVSLKTLIINDIEPTAKGRSKQIVGLRNALAADDQKQLLKIIKALNLKSINSAISGESIRVSAKSKDDLQKVIAHLKTIDFDLPLNFVNFRD